MPKIARKVKIFSALEVANICGVVNQTAINWIKNGYLKAFTTPGGQYRIYAKDLAAFLDTRGMRDSGEALQGLLENVNFDTLLIAIEEPTNSRLRDELTRLLPDFTFVQAFDGFDLGLRLVAEKPGFILLDKDIQGVNYRKIIRLLKTEPLYGKPYIFITGDSPAGNYSDADEPADRAFPKPPDAEAIYRSIKDFEKQTEAIA